MTRRFRLGLLVMAVAGFGLAAPAVHADPRIENTRTVFCAYADNPWARHGDDWRP